MPRRRRPLGGARRGARLAVGGAAGRQRGGLRARRPAHAVAGELGERQAAVERDRLEERGARGGAAERPALRAQARRELREHRPFGADLALAGDRRAQALDAAVRVGDGPLLLGGALGGEDDARVLADRVAEEGRVHDHGGRVLERVLPGGAVGKVAQRVDAEQIDGGQLAGAERGRDRGCVQTAVQRRVGEARAAVGKHARLAQPAAVRGVGDAEQPRPRRAGEPERVGEREQPGGAAVEQALAVEDHDLRARVAQRLRERGEILGALVLAAQHGGERARELRAAARSEAQRRGGLGVERARAVGRDGERDAVAPHALADAQLEDRRRIDRLAVEHEHGVRELEIGDARGERGSGECAPLLERHGAGRARVQVRRGEHVAQQAAEQEALLVARPRAGERRGARSGAAQAAGGLGERPLPADGAKLAAVADHRRGDALVDVDRLVGEAALVAQPAVVNLVVLAGEHAQHALVAHRQRDVALRGAQRAQRSGALDLPRPRAEAVGARGERADGTQLDDVAAEGRDVGVAVEGADERVRSALEQDQLVVLGDLLRVAHAAVAEDAALAVDRDEGRELERLAEVALGLDEARVPAAPAEGDVLERALAALVADRAVQRMVDEQELDDRLLGGARALGLGVDDHPVLDRRRARGLELGDPLDLDEAHAAGADRLTELGLVAEDRDLDVAQLGGVGQHHVLGRLDLATVDLEGDRVVLGAWHYAAMAASRRDSMCASSSGRNFAMIEPIGIAIASPSTHRQLPMM